MTSLKKNRFLYISCAPRVSLRLTSENLAARNHINSVIKAFKNRGFKIKKFILGDFLPSSFSSPSSQKVVSGSLFSRFFSDIFRIFSRFACQFWLLVKYYDNDIIYERFGSFQAGGLLLKRSGKKWILESNAILYEESYGESKSILLWRLAKFMEGHAYRRCDILICVSDSLKHGIIKEFKIDVKKILVVPNAVDTSFFKPKNIPREPNVVTLGYVGSLVKWQSLDKLILAVDKIDDELKKNLKIQIVGEGPERLELEYLVNDKHLTNCIEFLGRVPFERMPSIINQFDLGFCLPSHKSDSSGSQFNSPMKLYEYLAMEKPVICALNDDLRRIKGSKDFVFLVDSSSIQEQLSLAIKQKDNLKKMGELARNAIIEGHSWDSRIEYILKRISNDT